MNSLDECFVNRRQPNLEVERLCRGIQLNRYNSQHQLRLLLLGSVKLEAEYRKTLRERSDLFGDCIDYILDRLVRNRHQKNPRFLGANSFESGGALIGYLLNRVGGVYILPYGFKKRQEEKGLSLSAPIAPNSDVTWEDMLGQYDDQVGRDDEQDW